MQANPEGDPDRKRAVYVTPSATLRAVPPGLCMRMTVYARSRVYMYVRM